MSDKDGHWTLGIQVNRIIGDKAYHSLRLYMPTNNDTKLLLKRLQTEGGEDAKLYYSAEINKSLKIHSLCPTLY